MSEKYWVSELQLELLLGLTSNDKAQGILKAVKETQSQSKSSAPAKVKTVKPKKVKKVKKSKVVGVGKQVNDFLGGFDRAKLKNVNDTIFG